MTPGRSIDGVRAVVMFGLILFPGIGVAVNVLRPGSVRPAALMASSLAFGYASVMLIGFTLASTHALSAPAVVIVWALLVGVSWGAGWRHLREHAGAFFEQIRAEAWPFIVGGAITVGFFLARLTFAPILSLGPTTLRYWADGMEIADAGQFPSHVLQWGQLLPPATSKIGLSSFYAASSLIVGRDPVRSLGVLLLVVSVSAFVVAWGLFDTLGVRWLGSIGALWLFGNVVAGQREFTADLTRGLAENWGRLAALAALMLAVLAFSTIPARASPGSDLETPMTRKQRIAIAARQDWFRFAVLAGAMLVVAAFTHLVPTAMFAGIAFLYAVATMVAARAPRQVLRVSAVALATAAVMGSTLLLLSPGDLGFKGTGGGQEYQAIRTAYGFPAGWDPTVFLTRGQILQPPPAPYGAADILELFENKTISGWGTKSLPEIAKAVPFAVAGLGLILVLVLGDRKLRVAGVTFVGFAFLLIGVGVYFAANYQTMVLQHFASRRLTDYWGLPFVVLGIGGIEAVLRRIAGPQQDHLHREVSEGEASEENSPSRTGRWSAARRAWQSRRRRVAISLAILLTLTVAMWFLPRLIRPQASDGIADRKLAPLAWIAKNVPCEGRILADLRTLATFELLTGHAGVLEGMGPHLRPSVLQIAVGELLEANRFFANPTKRYLTDRGIAAVVVTGPGIRIGGWRLRSALHEDAALLTAPFLDPVYQTSDATIYLVTGFQPNPSLPRVQGTPGYRCEAADV